METSYSIPTPCGQGTLTGGDCHGAPRKRKTNKGRIFACSKEDEDKGKKEEVEPKRHLIIRGS